MGGLLWAVIAFGAVSYHLLHDTGWTTTRSGIAWFWPFVRSYFSQRGFYRVRNQLGHREFLKTHWLTPSRMSVWEIGIGSTFLFLALLLTGFSCGVSVALPAGIVFSAVILWSGKDQSS